MMESRGRGSGGARSGQIGSPMSPPDLGMASDAELQQMIHAGERELSLSAAAPRVIAAPIKPR